MSNKFVPRIYMDTELLAGATVCSTQSKAHYLRSVMRMNVGDGVLVFNATDGEYSAKIKSLSKSSVEFEIGYLVREPYNGYDITLLSAPLQKDNFRLVVEKATELGVTKIRPVISELTNAPKVRIDKAQQHIMGAVEQCERLDVPEISQEEKLTTVIRRWDSSIPIVYCYERGGEPIAEIANAIRDKAIAVLVGPEGGFSTAEHKLLIQQEYVHPVSLGPRILRSETATIAVLSVLQSTVGDWRN